MMTQPDSPSLPARAANAMLAMAFTALLLWIYWPMVGLFDLFQADLGYRGVWIGGGARQVTAVDPGGAAARTGLQAGDVLEFDRNREADWILASYRQMPESFSATLPVRHADGSRSVAHLAPERIVHLPTMNDRLSLLARLGTLTFAMLLGTLLVWVRPGLMTWSLFFVFAATSFARPWINYYLAFQAGHGHEWIPFVRAISAAGAVALVPFAVCFPRKTMTDISRGKLALGTVVVLAFGAFTTRAFRVTPFEYDAPAPVGATTFIAVSILSCLAAVAILWRAYSKAENTDRARLQWALTGMSATLVASALTIAFLFLPYVLTNPIGGATATPVQWTAALVFGVLFPAATAYAVLNRRVVGVQFTLSRALVLGVALVLVLAFVAALHWLLGRMFPTSAFTFGIEALAALGVGIVLYRSRQRIGGLVDSVLFRKHHFAQQQLHRVIATLPHATRVRDIADAVVGEAVRNLDLASAALFFRESPDEPLRRTLSLGWGDGHTATLEADALLVRYLQAEYRPLRLRDAQWLPPSVPEGAALPVLAIPLMQRHVLIAVVLYGAHTDSALPDPDEVALLHTLVQAAAASLERLRVARHKGEAAQDRAAQPGPVTADRGALARPRDEVSAIVGERGGRGVPAPTQSGVPGTATRLINTAIAAVIAAFLLSAYLPMVKLLDLSQADLQYSGAWIGGDAKRITAVVPGGGADRAGLRAGDVLEFDRMREADWVLASYRQMPEGFSATLPVRHADGSRTEVALVPERVAHLPTLNDRLALLARLGTFTFAILFGTYLIWTRPGPMTWSLFLTFAATIPGRQWMQYFLAFDAGHGFELMPALRGFVGSMAVALVPFALCFPRKTLKDFTRWQVALGLLLVLIWGAVGSILFAVAPFAYDRPSPLGATAFISATSLSFLVAVAILWRAYAKAQDSDRARLKWVLAGISAVIVAIVSALLFVILPTVLSAEVGYGSGAPSSWLLTLLTGILWPLIAGYAILRHRVVDVQFAVSRTLVYGGAAVFMLVFVVALHWLVGHTVEPSALTLGLEGLAALGLALVLYLSRHRIYRLVDSVLFRQHHLAEQRLRRVVAALPYATEERSIGEALVVEATRHLDLASAALFLRDAPDGPLRRVLASDWSDEHATTLDADTRLLRRLRAERRPLRLDDAQWLPAGAPGGVALPVLAIPLLQQQTLIGVVLYGAHANSTLPDPDEVALLHMLAQAAAASREHLRVVAPVREEETAPAQMPQREPAAAERSELARPLVQDDAIPGNRKDGFRYRHLLFIIAVTPIYLWFELSFGVHLLDGISSKVAAGDTDAIEHWGRFISGCAVALLFLSGWVRQCEKLDTPWPTRIVVGVAISIACVVVTWWGQGKLIDFYIQRSTTDIGVALVLLLALMIAGFLILRAWIRYSIRSPQVAQWRTVLGLVAILGAGYVLISGVSAVLPTHPERLGLERQRAATLTLVRQSIQHGYYGVLGVERDERALASAEGKAFLALFTVFGTVLDQERFARDRASLLAETMYRDWDEQSGQQAFAAFQAVVRKVRTEVLTDYATASRALSSTGNSSTRDAAQQSWDSIMRALLDGESVAPGLSAEAFLRDPAVARYMGRKLGCFDCEFTVGMDRPAFGREFHKWTQAHNVKQAVETFGSARHFESGRDGERAARTYWVPIWALLFSMLGAFTHIFKLIFTATEYAHRVNFNRFRAADSPLAHQVVRTSSIVTAAVVFGLATFVYFLDNRVTGNERYAEMRARMWQTSPIVGGLAAHWTVNAQGLIYPFTRKIRPSWLGFDTDPLAVLPFASARRSDD